MTIHFGPMLYAAASDDAVWRFHVGALVDDADDVTLEVDGAPVVLDKVVHKFPALPNPPAPRAATKFVRFHVEAARADKEREVSYELTVGGAKKRIDGVRIPAKDTWPRMLFFSCNGVDDPKRLLKLDDAHALWNDIYVRQRDAAPPGAQHDPDRAHHVCIGGGDQIYCDSLFFTDAYLKRWRELPKRERVKAEPNDDERRGFLDGYVDLYTSRWWNTRTKCGDVFSRVPCAFTWDDHDIFDGWGSHEPALNSSPVHKALYEHARTCFEVFQRGGAPAAVSGHHLGTWRFGSVGLVLTDSRSHRTPTQVLGDAQHADLREALTTKMKGAKHVLIVTSVPVIYRGFGIAESVLRLLPGVMELEDDLRDQWESPAHAAERRDFLTLLLECAKDIGARITLVSGDVHMGSRAKCTSTKPRHLVAGEAETVIHQVTSSAIVFPPPSWEQLAGLAVLDQKPRDVQTGVTTSLVDVAPPRPFLIERNWLSITPRGDRLRFRFMTERGPSTEITINPRPSA